MQHLRGLHPQQHEPALPIQHLGRIFVRWSSIVAGATIASLALLLWVPAAAYADGPVKTTLDTNSATAPIATATTATAPATSPSGTSAPTTSSSTTGSPTTNSSTTSDTSALQNQVQTALSTLSTFTSETGNTPAQDGGTTGQVAPVQNAPPTTQEAQLPITTIRNELPVPKPAEDPVSAAVEETAGGTTVGSIGSALDATLNAAGSAVDTAAGSAATALDTSLDAGGDAIDTSTDGSMALLDAEANQLAALADDGEGMLSDVYGTILTSPETPQVLPSLITPSPIGTGSDIPEIAPVPAGQGVLAGLTEVSPAEPATDSPVELVGNPANALVEFSSGRPGQGDEGTGIAPGPGAGSGHTTAWSQPGSPVDSVPAAPSSPLMPVVPASLMGQAQSSVAGWFGALILFMLIAPRFFNRLLYAYFQNPAEFTAPIPVPPG